MQARKLLRHILVHFQNCTVEKGKCKVTLAIRIQNDALKNSDTKEAA